MIYLQYFDGTDWIDCGTFHHEDFAWISLGGDDSGYRTVDENGKVLTDKSNPL
jgi:expansin (peptidoglycan-binding protein)